MERLEVPTIKPLAMDSSCYLVLKEDHPAAISVGIFGNPTPSVKWFLGQRQVKDCSEYRISSDVTTGIHVFNIANATEELDKGVLVAATNCVGVRTCVFDITIFKLKSKIRYKNGLRVQSCCARADATGSARLRAPSSDDILYEMRSQMFTDRLAASFSSSLSMSDYLHPRTVRRRKSNLMEKGQRNRKAYSCIDNSIPVTSTPSILPILYDQVLENTSQECLSFSDTQSSNVFLSLDTLDGQPEIGSRDMKSENEIASRDSASALDWLNGMLWNMYGFKINAPLYRSERNVPGKGGEDTSNRIHTNTEFARNSPLSDLKHVNLSAMGSISSA